MTVTKTTTPTAALDAVVLATLGLMMDVVPATVDDRSNRIMTKAFTRSSSVVNEGRSKKPERFGGSTKATEQRTHEVGGKGGDDKVATDKSTETSKTAPKGTSK
ncbi:hypothetical protein FIE12Z_12289 [Fusarium flagelliforme]|uniref:Uncharacterized protein n=1 Tax=Fusarium flagelliforme TaxID=2675880 RepID=A0A395M6H4_9HYPO|nr:hypothetical protein FIE12Z_12289 [Fusarium flagelliforme]